MLVVILIIGIVLAGAVLSLGSTGRDRQLEQERDRLTALIAYVRDRGALMATEYGIRCGQHGYRFVYFDNRTNQWMPETLDDTLRLRKLPPDLDLQLVIEGRPIVLDDNALKFDDTPIAQTSAGTDPLAPATDLNTQVADNAPQIMLLSNGDINSFALTIERGSSHRTVTLASTTDGTVSAGNIIEPAQ